MKRVLLDTNIYGELMIDPDIELVKKDIKSDSIIYGLRLIRKELRAVSKMKYIGDHSLRISLLSLYNEIIGRKEYEITEEMKRIAESYYKIYRELGGSKSIESIINDFLIVACASVHGIDVVVSEDEKSMLTENAVRAYRLVNEIMKKRLPNFIGYEAFKKMLRGG